MRYFVRRYCDLMRAFGLVPAARISCQRSVFTSIFVAASFLLIHPGSPAHAQQRIGAAVAVQNDVTAFRAGTSVRLSPGGSVFRSEAVATGAASSARLTFLDDTNLSVGPSSRVVLDEFVYKGGSKAETVTINLARGAFRFATGSSDKNAYKIQTSTATIGVRGTVLDISSQSGQTLVTLQDDGAAFLCVTGTANCATLNIRGQTFVIDTGSVRRSDSPRTRFTFQQYCTGGLCGRTRIAEQPGDLPAQPGPPPVLQQAILTPVSPPAGCNTGACLPVEQRQVIEEPIPPPAPQKWAGLANAAGSASSLYGPTPLSASLGLELPATQAVPIQNGDQITASVVPILGNYFSATAAAPLTVVARVDPGFQYTAWGEWNGQVTLTSGSLTAHVNRGFALFGTLTDPQVIAQKTGTAIYTGPVLGDFTNNNSVVSPGAIGGTAQLNANFGAQTMSGSLNLTLNGNAWAAPTFTNLPIGTTSGSGPAGSFSIYSGNFSSSPSGGGTLAGAFTGPAGTETAGRFEYFKSTGNSTDGSALGIFRGKQGAAP